MTLGWSENKILIFFGLGKNTEDWSTSSQVLYSKQKQK